MQPSNFSGLSLFILCWEAPLNLHVYNTITFKEDVDLVQRITWPVHIELPSRSLLDPCSIVFIWKLLKLRILRVAQTTVVKMCITLIKSEISISYHKTTRSSIKSRNTQLLILSPKSLKNYLFFYFKWLFFTNKISLKDTLSVFPNLFIYFAA